MPRRIIQDINGKVAKLNDMIKRMKYHMDQMETFEEPLVLVDTLKDKPKWEGKLLRLPPNIRVVNDKKE